jgi:hypothetical protein
MVDYDHVKYTESGLERSQHVDRTDLLLGHLVCCIRQKHKTFKEQEGEGAGKT